MDNNDVRSRERQVQVVEERTDFKEGTAQAQKRLRSKSQSM